MPHPTAGRIVGPLALLVVGVLGATACGDDGASAKKASPRRASTTTASSTTATTVAPPPTTVATLPPTTTTAVPAAPAPSAYPATIAPIDPATAQRMTGVSWRPGCPVALADLRLLHLPYRGFDGAVHTGELVVSARWADGVVSAFHRLFDAGYPIERMQLIDDYGASDDASVLANNTSAFNCRAVTGGSGWSRHAYGVAIDIDPRQNPYVYPDGHVLDPASGVYTNRGRTDPGMIHPGDALFRAFSALGWRWGGYFSDGFDPQHFDSGDR